MYKVAIVENYPLFSAGIVSILKQKTDVEVIADVYNINTLVTKSLQIKPDVIVFDVIHSENSGIQSLEKIRKHFTKTPILIITNADYGDYFQEYIRLGVKGFILSNGVAEELGNAIKKLKNSEEYFPNEVWDILKKTIQSQKYTTKKDNKLSFREVTVLKLFTQGLSYKEIGAQLNISARTVETHKNNILAKLRIHSTAEMVKYAFRKNIIV